MSGRKKAIPCYVGSAENVLDSPRAFLSLLESASMLGGVVRVQGERPFFLLSDPHPIQQALARQHSKLFKRLDDRPAARRLFGNGLLTSDGETWRRHRRLVQPAFTGAHLNRYVPTIVEVIGRHTASWRAGMFFDLLDEMECLTMRAAAATLFGLDVTVDGSAFGEVIDGIVTSDLRQIVSALGSGRAELSDLDHHLRYIDDTVDDILEQKLNSSRRGDDALSDLMVALERGEITREDLRDQTITLLIAGYETTALASTWAWYLLSADPRARAALDVELDEVLGESLPTAESLPMLRYVRSAVFEALRLYPPVYAFGRTTREELTLGDYRLPAGADICISPWVMHRSARFFESPTEFRPDRWLDGLMDCPPPYVYIPFGAGPRGCLGSRFAPLETSLILATIGQKFSFELQTHSSVEPVLVLTLRPEGGLPVKLAARRSAPIPSGVA